MTDKLIIADASLVSGKEFFDALFKRDENDISNCPQAGGYFYRDGGWRKIKPHHVGVKDALPPELKRTGTGGWL